MCLTADSNVKRASFKNDNISRIKRDIQKCLRQTFKLVDSATILYS